MKAADLGQALLQALAQPIGYEVVAEFTRGDRRLAVVVRQGGDVQVELHLPERRESPFEALFVIGEGERAEGSAEIAEFVEGLLQERLVLAYDGRLLRGGRRFVPPEKARRMPGVRWVASWNGTHDREG